MSILVIGIGNPDRGDDAVGIRVVECLQTRSVPGVRFATMGGDMLALFDRWEQASQVLLVDAMQSGAEPGTVRRLDASACEISNDLASFVSSHAFNLAEAIELARSLDRLPEQLVIFGIEARDFTPGQEMSAPVSAAVEVAAQNIEEECLCMKRR